VEVNNTVGYTNEANGCNDAMAIKDNI